MDVHLEVPLTKRYRCRRQNIDKLNFISRYKVERNARGGKLSRECPEIKRSCSKRVRGLKSRDRDFCGRNRSTRFSYGCLDEFNSTIRG